MVAQRDQQALAGRDGRLPVGVRHEDHELLAARPDEVVAHAQAPDEHVGDADQDVVPGGVSAVVVDLLEVVEVDHGDAHRRRGRAVGELGQARVEEAAVVQPGERVAVGLVAERPVGRCQRVGLPAGGAGVGRRALEAHLQLRELHQRLALERGGARGAS